MNDNFVEVSASVSSPDEYKEGFDEAPQNLNTNNKSPKDDYVEVESGVEAEPVAPVYYLGNIKGQSGVRFGESKYDEGMPTSELGRLDAARADEQGFLSSLGNGLLSRTASIVPKFLEGFGFVGTAPLALIDQDVSKMANNELSDKMAAVDNNLRKAFPVYASDSYNGSILSKMTSRKFWFDDVFDGLAFSAAAFIPAGMIGKVGEAMGLSAKALELFEAGNKVGSALLKALPEAIVTSYNVMSEAGFESKDSYNTIFKAAKDRGLSDIEAKKLASAGAAHTYAANLAILALPDAIQTKFFMGGFKNGTKSVRKMVMDAALKGEKYSVNIGKEVGKKIALGIASEGIWEEGIQNGVQQWEQRAAKNGAYNGKGWLESLEAAVGGDISEYIRGFSTDTGITSMVLGSITGGLMGGAFTYNEAKEEKAEAQRVASAWDDTEKSILDRNNEFFKSRIVDAVNKKTGSVNINELARQIFRTVYDKQMFDEEAAAMIKDDKFHHKYNQKMNTARMIYGYLANNNFDNTDMAFDYAMKHLDKIKEENPDAVDDEALNEIKADAREVKELYDKLESDRHRIDGFTDEQKKINFGRIVNKTILYEKLKQNYLNEIKTSLDDKHHGAIDNMVNDSQKRIDDLTNKSKRAELFKDFKDFNSTITDRVKNAEEISRIESEFAENENYETGEELSEKDRETKAKRYRKLLYKTRESELIYGERPSSVFDATEDSELGLQDLEKSELGILNNGRFMHAMRYEKNANLKKVMASYKDGKASISDVLTVLKEHTNNAAPYTKSDIKLLKTLLSDARAISNTVSDNILNAYNIYDANMKPGTIEEEKAKELANISDSEILEAKKALDAKKNIAELSDIINNNEQNTKFELTDKELNDGLRESTMQGIAMSKYIEEEVDALIQSYNNNKETFSDTEGTETASQSLLSAEEALKDSGHKNLKKSNFGKALADEITAKKALLKDILEKASENKNNKNASDKAHSEMYGKIKSFGLIGESNSAARSIINRYLGANHVETLLEAMSLDGHDPIYIEKLIKDLRKLKKEEIGDVLASLEEEKSKRVKLNAERLWAFIMNSDAGKQEAMAKMIFGPEIRRYETSPENYFKYILAAIGLSDFETETTTPFEIFSNTGSLPDFIEALAKLEDGEETGLQRINAKELTELTSTHSEIESLTHIISSIETKSSVSDILSNEKKAYNSTDTKIYPSRQQRIAIREIVSWFNSKNKVSEITDEKSKRAAKKAMHGFAYLRGIAGSGKTTVVANYFLKYVGLSIDDVLSVGRNESSTTSLNNSIGTDSKVTIADLSKENISDKTKLVIVDEIGAASSAELSNLRDIVNEINTKRREENKEELKVLLMGDPTQISGKEYIPEIERKSNSIHTLRQIEPLTVAYRSNIGDIVNFQLLFMNNRNEVLGARVSASAPLGHEAVGVHVGTTQKQLLAQIEAHKNNGKSKVIIVSDKESVERYNSLKESVPGLEVLTIDDVQGRTFDEVFIDLDLSGFSNNLPGSSKIVNNKNRNRLLYTATSRASDYIFMIDNTSSFKNKISTTVEMSKAANEKALEEYRNQYGDMLTHDESILNTGEAVKPVEKKDKNPETVTNETVGNVSRGEDDYITTEENTEVEDKPYQPGSEEGAVDGKFEKTSDEVHTLDHPESLVEKTEGFLHKFNIKPLISAGSKVYYMRMQIAGQNRIAAVATKVDDDPSKGFFILGILNDKESQRYLGKPISEVLNSGSSVRFVANGKIRNFDEKGDYILRTGRVSAVQALTYVFKKAVIKGPGVLTDAIAKVSSVFSPKRGLKLESATVKILNKADIHNHLYSDLLPGIPYLFLEYSGSKGNLTHQHVRLSPRMMDSVKDSGLLRPLLDFKDTIKNIEDIFNKEGIDSLYGSSEFNRLIKEFKKNFRLNSKKEMELKSVKERISFEEAQAILPGLTNKAFKETSSLFENVIPMLYGVGERDIILSPDEFDDFVKNNNLTPKGTVDGNSDVYFATDNSTLEGGKGRYYKYDKKTGKIRYWVATEKDGETKLVNDKVYGYAKRFMSSQQIAPEKGPAQTTLNILAKNNKAPGGINIRTRRANRRKDNIGYRYITGRSLTKSENSIGDYLSALRSALYDSIEEGKISSTINPYGNHMLDMSMSMQIKIISDELKKNNVFSDDDLVDLSKTSGSTPITSEDLDKMLGFGKGTESSTLRLPLRLEDINELGSDLNNEDNLKELESVLEHNLDSVLPTRAQVKLDGTITKSKPSAKKRVDAKEKTKRKKSQRIVRRKPMLESDRIYDNSLKVSKKEFIDELRRRIPEIKNKQIKFVEQLMIENPATGMEELARAAVLGDKILIAKTSDDLYNIEVAKHEAFHYIRNNVLSNKEYSKLEDAFSGEFGAYFDELSDFEKEEFIAGRYQVYQIGDYAPKDSFIEKIFKYIKDFLSFITDNKQYIESVFRGIEEGKFQRATSSPIGLDLHNLRKKYGTTENFKLATTDILESVKTLVNDGFEKVTGDGIYYPVPIVELYEKSRNQLSTFLEEDYELLRELKEDYDNAPDNEKEKILSDVDEVSGRIAREELTIKNYSEMFDVVFPFWMKKINFENEDQQQHDEDAAEGTANINDDIIEWERVNMANKISGSVKNILSNIFYKDEAGENRWVNPKYAYIKSLEILSLAQPWSINFESQLEKLKDDEVDPAGLAVIEKIESMYYDSRDIVGQEGKARTDIRFFNGDIFSNKTGKVNKFKFIIAKDESANLYSSYGIDGIKQKKIGIIEEESTFATLQEFVDYLSEKYHISINDLFNAYTAMQSRNTFTELMSNFGSQRRRNIKYIYKNDGGTSASFRYFTGTGRTATATSRTFVREAIFKHITNENELRRLNSNISKTIDKAFEISDAAKRSEFIVRRFVTAIGLGDSIKKYGLKRKSAVRFAADKIELVFGKASVASNIIDTANEKFNVDNLHVEPGEKLSDEILEQNEKEKVAYIINELSTRVGAMINAVGDSLDVDSRIKRATSVKAADGKKKYVFVVSNQALDMLNTYISMAKTNTFKGVSGIGKRGLEYPGYISTSFMKNNIYVNGDSVLYDVDDYDGKRVENSFTNNTDIIEYKDEKLQDTLDRSFSAQFLDVIKASSKGSIQYVQSPFIVSNKPVHNPVKVLVLNKSKQKAAIHSMMRQFLADIDYSNVKGFDKHKMVAMNAFARGIEEVISGSTTAAYNKKNGGLDHYVLSDAAYNKLKEAYDSNDKALLNKISNSIDKQLKVIAKNLTDKILSRNLSIPLDSFVDKNVLKLLQKEDADNVKLLKKNRHIDPNTNEIVYSDKNRTDNFEYRESLKEVRERLISSEKYGKYFTEDMIDDSSKFMGAVVSLREKDDVNIDISPKSLISEKEILPVMELFVANDYIQSNQITQLVSGDFRFFKSPNDLVKRLSGAFAPGIIGNVNDETGMPKHTNIAVIDDITYSREETKSFLTDNLGLSEKEATSILPFFGGKDAEYADGQGFMLPERKDEIIAGFGEAYGAGNVMKPAYYHIDSNGTPRMLKYSSTVLSDDLIDEFPVLGKLRDKMRSAGENGGVAIGEVVFASGNKVGTPSELTSVNDILGEKGINMNSVFVLDNSDYRMQLNPIHPAYDSVANPTQLSYFLNTMENNLEDARAIYGYVARINKARLDSAKEKLYTISNVKNTILNKLKSGRNNEDTYEVMESLAHEGGVIRPWDFPQISSKALIALNSYINKNISQIRFDGTKAVLQTAFGTEKLDEVTKALSHTLNYNHEKLDGYDNKDVMYAEAIFPSGLLPKAVEDKIKAEIKENGVSNMEFLTPDALGFRLPSSELHSAVPLRVKGFYDSKGTNVIIAPRQIVDLHGSDYDVDALFMMIREYKRKEGKRTATPIGYKLNEKTNKYEFDYEFLESKEFNNLDINEQESYLKNAILERSLDVVSRMDNRSRMSAPITMGFIKDDISEINSLRNAKKIKESDLSNFLDRQLTHSSSYEASTAVGIWANGIKVIAYLQRTNDGKNPELYATKEDGKPGDRAFWFDGRRYAVLSNSEEMYRTLDGFLNTTIDNVKEQDLPELNMTSENIRAYIALMAFGFKMDIANRIFAQDVIAYNNIADANSRVLAARIERDIKSLQNVSEDFGNPIDLNKDMLDMMLGYNKGIEEILSNIEDGEKISKEDLMYLEGQLSTLRLFNRAMEVGKTLSNISKMLSVLRETPVTKEEIDDVVEIKNKLITELGDDVYESVISDFNFSGIMKNLPHLKEMFNIIEFQKDLNEKTFTKYNAKINDQLLKIDKRIKITYDQDKIINAKKRTEEFINFIYKQVKFDPEYAGFSSEKPIIDSYGKRMLYNEKAFRQRVINNVIIMKKSDEFIDNLFVQGLQITRDQFGKQVIKFPAGSNMNYEDIIDFQNAFDELVNFDVNNGKVEGVNISDDESVTLGYSKLQKDLFRMLIVDDGLAYSPDSYIQIVPSKLKGIFQKSFEKFMYDRKTGLLHNDNNMARILDIYRINLVVNYPFSIPAKYISNSAIKNENEFGSKYAYSKTTPNGIIYGDLAFKSETRNNGSVDLNKVNSKYPEFIRTGGVVTKAGKRRVSVYKRVYVDSEVVLYQKISNNNFEIYYAQFDSEKISDYNEGEGFNPFVKHVKVADLNVKEFKTHNVYNIGDLISISTFNDPARANIKYVEIKSIVKGNDDVFTYNVGDTSQDVDINIPDKRRELETEFKTLAQWLESPTADKTTASILKFIGRKNPQYKTITDILLRFNNTNKTQIVKESSRGKGVVGGFHRPNKITRSEMVRIRDIGGYVSVDVNKTRKLLKQERYTEVDLADSIVHETIHQYSANILDLFDMASAKERNGEVTSAKEYLLEHGLSNKEVLFAERINSLYNEYLAKGNKESDLFKNATDNAAEFVAYGLTDEHMINELKSIKVEDKTLFQKLIDFLADLFGVDSGSMHSFLTASLNDLAEGDNMIANTLGVSVGSVVDAETLNEFLKYIRIDTKSKVLNYNKTLTDYINESDSKEFAVAGLLKAVSDEYPEYRQVASSLLKLNNGILGRINNMKIGNKNGGETVIKLKSGKVYTGVKIDMHYINSLSNDVDIRKRELATTILHEELHRYTYLLDAYRDKLNLSNSEKTFLTNMDKVFNSMQYDLKVLDKYGDETALNMLEDIDDINEMVAYGITDFTYSEILKNMVSPLDNSISVYDEIMNQVKILFKGYASDINSVYSNIVQTNSIKEINNSSSEEDNQRNAIKCGI